MVENHVHHHLQSLAVRLINKAAVFVVGAETWVNAVIVGGGIAVIGALCLLVGGVVLQHGRKPQGCNAQLVEVIQVLANAFQVAPVAQAGLRAVHAIRV